MRVLAGRRGRKVDTHILGEAAAVKQSKILLAFPLSGRCNANARQCLFARWLLELVLRELRPGELAL